MSAALEQLGIKLSPRTCGRILALNRHLYDIKPPKIGGRPKKELPFKAERRHPFGSSDIRSRDMHRLGDGLVYCISILEHYSRAILASALSRRQNFEAVVAVLSAAVRTHGYPEALVSDSGGVFLAQRARQIYKRLGIRKAPIQKRQSWQNDIESGFNVQRRMGDWYVEKATSL